MKKENMKKAIELSLMIAMIMIVYGFIVSRIGFNLILTGLALFFEFFVVLNYINSDKFEMIMEKIFKYRWLVYLLVFIICVFFRVHGSSIGEYSKYFQEKLDYSKNATLMGNSRIIRSDEYLVLTPYYISQTYNGFSKYSSMVGLSPQNMIIGYNSPVKDITSFCKPLLWGYMLFGKDVGLSWYWCMKLILLFAFALECSYIFTKNKKIAILGGFLVALGPSTLWWFAPHMPDVILWMMAILSVTYYYLTTESKGLKNFFTVILPFIITEFIIAIFPSFQVGLGIFLVVMLILLIIRDKIDLISPGNQWIRHSIVIVSTIVLAGYFILTNLDALKLVLNSAYPGKRISLGGDQGFSSIFTSLATIFLPYKDITFSNNCEVSTYIHFGFFITLLFPMLLKIMKKRKDRDLIIGVGMLIVLSVYSAFMIFGFPEWLAKLTFFSYINRMKMIVGLISIFYTVWGVNQILKYKTEIPKSYYIFSCLAFCGIQLFFITDELKTYMSSYIFILEIISFFIILLALYFRYEKFAISGIMSLLLFAGLTINPIVVGTSDIYNHPSSKYMRNIIKKDPKPYWLGYNSLVLQNYILANGGKSINAVNYYMDEKKWKILDSKRKYDDIYNRYAHFQVMFTKNENDKIKLENPTSDSIKIELNLQDLINLKVKYILSSEELDRENDNYKLSEKYKDKDCIIYEIINKNYN